MRFTCDLPSQTIVCTELLVKDYKDLIKNLYGETLNDAQVIDSVCSLLCSVTNKPKDVFMQMSVVDLFCLLLEIRMNSLGEICPIIITKNENKNKAQLNLQDIKNDLMSVLEPIILYENLQITIGCPCIKDLLDSFKGEYVSFIKKIVIKDKEFILTSNEERQFLLSQLPIKAYIEITKAVDNLIEELNSINFLNNYEDEFLGFSLSPNSLIWYIKLFYGEPLDVFYKNFFELCYRGNMNPVYLENISVGEYNYFITCLREALSPSQPDDSLPEYSEEVDENEE